MLPFTYCTLSLRIFFVGGYVLHKLTMESFKESFSEYFARTNVTCTLPSLIVESAGKVRLYVTKCSLNFPISNMSIRLSIKFSFFS